jgi:flavodoxin
MPAANALVVCYSRTGTTRLVADAIASRLGCAVEELVDTRRRTGLVGTVRSAYDAIRRKLTVIAPIRHTPSDYSLVVIGGPVWAGSLPPAVRAYLTSYGATLPRVAFFCTEHASGAGAVFQEMTRVSGRAPVAVLAVHADEVARSAYLRAVDEFADAIGQSRAAA